LDRALYLTEYSGTLKPKTSLGISAFARIIERKAHGYFGAAPATLSRPLAFSFCAAAIITLHSVV
jgi:hypothetical protein